MRKINLLILGVLMVIVSFLIDPSSVGAVLDNKGDIVERIYSDDYVTFYKWSGATGIMVWQIDTFCDQYETIPKWGLDSKGNLFLFCWDYSVDAYSLTKYNGANKAMYWTTVLDWIYDAYFLYIDKKNNVIVRGIDESDNSFPLNLMGKMVQYFGNQGMKVTSGSLTCYDFFILLDGLSHEKT